MPAVSDLAYETYSGDDRIDALLWTYADWNYSNETNNTISYSFQTSSATSGPFSRAAAVTLRTLKIRCE